MTDQQNLAVPGVTVTIQSPALQGVRTTVSAGDGIVFVPAGCLPAATRSTFEIASFAPVKRTADVLLGLLSRAERHAEPPRAARRSAGRRRVAGADRQRRSSGQLQARTKSRRSPRRAACRASRSSRLASPRTPRTPASSPSTARFAFDNVFMLNGVDVNDNLFGSPQNLFIEDAIEETQVLTSGHYRRVRPLHGRRGERRHQDRRQHASAAAGGRTSPIRPGPTTTPFERARPA